MKENYICFVLLCFLIRTEKSTETERERSNESETTKLTFEMDNIQPTELTSTLRPKDSVYIVIHI